MFCSKCGTQIDESAQFCQKCGAAVGTARAETIDGATSRTTADSSKAATGRWGKVLGWLFVILGIVSAFSPMPAEGLGVILAFVFFWLGLSLVFPGSSAILKVGKGFVGAIVLGLFTHYLGGAFVPPSGAPAVDAMKVSIETLLRDYKTNEVGADQKYKGRVIETEGYVTDIKKDITGTPYVLVTDTLGALASLNGGLGESLQCSLSDVGATQAASIAPGKRVVVQGRVDGLMIYVQAADCMIIAAPNPPAQAQSTPTAPSAVSGEPPSGSTDPAPTNAVTQAMASAPEAEEEWRPAECEITSEGQTVTIPCRAIWYTGGTFSLKGIGDAELLPGITDLSVAADETDAEIMGLTKDGINSRWGAAERDAADASCWKGSEFRVCARPK